MNFSRKMDSDLNTYCIFLDLIYVSQDRNNK